MSSFASLLHVQAAQEGPEALAKLTLKDKSGNEIEKQLPGGKVSSGIHRLTATAYAAAGIRLPRLPCIASASATAMLPLAGLPDCNCNACK